MKDVKKVAFGFRKIKKVGGHWVLRIIEEDDGNWYESDVEFSPYWIEELIMALEKVKERLPKKERKKLEKRWKQYRENDKKRKTEEDIELELIEGLKEINYLDGDIEKITKFVNESNASYLGMSPLHFAQLDYHTHVQRVIDNALGDIWRDPMAG